MTFVVGLTGGIGCGKSTACQFFSALGIDVIDTDEIARQLTQPQGLAINAIQDTFGNTFITPEGALDREKMRNLIYSDSDSRLKLEHILHPLIRKETINRIALTRSPYTIVVIPLLFETSDYDTIVQRVLVIDCEEEQQISRTIARSHLSEQKVKAIMATQTSRKDRIQKANDIIINRQEIDDLKDQVTRLHHKYMMLSKKIDIK
ncbi:MAG: dephospho-CoA kinase [Pseudomonadota bacterium]